jgi:hypothetical protein
MLSRLRESMAKSPWLGWVVALGILGVAIAMYFLRGGDADAVYSPEAMREKVTIRYTDTNEEVEIPRGRLDKMLRESALDPAKGLINPKTGQASGFLVNKREWEDMINRIKDENAEAARQKPGKAPAPKPAGEK